MSYETAIASMFALGHELANMPAHKFDLAHMRVLLEALDNPQERFPAVLIAGTNGKGSTAATLASILHASGLRTGLYTSPHLIALNERIRIDGIAIGDDEFAELHGAVDHAAEQLVSEGNLPWHPSFFEMLTAIAFEHFARQDVDIAVLEVGMGGRLDATNVVEPLLSVITDISLDHQKYLGETVTEIAREKAGIIRPGGIVVTLPQQPQANDVIGNTILELNAHGVSAVPYVPPVSPASDRYFAPAEDMARIGQRNVHEDGVRKKADWEEQSVLSSLNEAPKEPNMLAPDVSPGSKTERDEAPKGRNHENSRAIPAPYLSRYPLNVMGKQIQVETQLIGRHQLRNIALAIAAAEELSKQGFTVTTSSIEQGIRQTRWPGRFEVVPATGTMPECVLDVAHNPAGAWALRSTLSSAYEDRPLTFVFGAMRDKAIAEMTEILFPLAEHVIATHADNPRSATPQEIHEAAARVSVEIADAPNVPAALEQARRLAGPKGLVVITGSIYVVGEAMRALKVRI